MTFPDLTSSAPRVGVGTKRKSTPHCTPLRTFTLSPLKSNQTKGFPDSPTLHRLAPLPPPSFTTRTPHTNKDTEAYLRRQTASLTKLSLGDSDEFGEVASDSGCELDDDDTGHRLFLDKSPPNAAGAQSRHEAALRRSLKGKEREEVAEVISPDGHVIKRRARSRPVSAELMEQVKSPTSPFKPKASGQGTRNSRPRHSGNVVFPSTRGRASPASSSDAGSPRPRRRINNAPAGPLRPSLPNLPLFQPSPLLHPRLETEPVPRAPLARLESAATLFFGPKIPPPTNTTSTNPTQAFGSTSTPALRSRTNSGVPPSTSAIARPGLFSSIQPNPSRHSYTGTGGRSGVDEDFDPPVWKRRDASPSPPGSSPFAPLGLGSANTTFSSHNTSTDVDMDEDEEMFFSGIGNDSSFVLNVNTGSPSLVKKPRQSLPMKFRGGTNFGNNSGFGGPVPITHGSMSVDKERDEEDELSSSGSSRFMGMPGLLSTSVGSSGDSGVSSSASAEDLVPLVTPCTDASFSSAWPPPTYRPPSSPHAHQQAPPPIDEDAFILKTLADASKGKSNYQPKKVPGTPVKKPRITFVGNDRPWQSAVAGNKTGVKEDCEFAKAPRKSLPAAFAGLGEPKTARKGPRPARDDEMDTDSEDEEDQSPIAGRLQARAELQHGKAGYGTLGLGKPTTALVIPPSNGLPKGPSGIPRHRWLMRRSSSGAFSSGSDSASLANTPTRAKGEDWQLSKPRLPLRVSPSTDSLRPVKAASSSTTMMLPTIGMGTRSASGSSSSGSSSVLNSPTNGNRMQRTTLGNNNGRKSFSAYDTTPIPGALHFPSTSTTTVKGKAPQGRYSSSTTTATASNQNVNPQSTNLLSTTLASRGVRRRTTTTIGLRNTSGSSLLSTSGSSGSCGASRRYSASFSDDDEDGANHQPGRFDREFVEIEEVGSGEFGKVIKARRKRSGWLGFSPSGGGADEDDEGQVYAIKKSKRFEGVKHRLRLREEVTVLKHLSQAAQRAGYRDGHPNVLAYIDSWEESEALYIQTELCESGNLARFLWEYGQVFPRLDESRVWKIVADLSDGLAFIHSTGVIHLDLKPSNVFITKEGRLKIGDFGMATLWPRVGMMFAGQGQIGNGSGGFEREGDKVYLAPEVLQGVYGPAADVFSLGLTILETASNIVVPDQGEEWHRLRQEDFSQVDLEEGELLSLVRAMMRTRAELRATMAEVCAHRSVAEARGWMDRTGQTVFGR